LKTGNKEKPVYRPKQSSAGSKKKDEGSAAASNPQKTDTDPTKRTGRSKGPRTATENQNKPVRDQGTKSKKNQQAK